jgi:hypothetical protein
MQHQPIGMAVHKGHRASVEEQAQGEEKQAPKRSARPVRTAVRHGGQAALHNMVKH